MHPFHAFAICSWGMRLRSSGQVFTVCRVKRLSYWLQGCRHAQITWKKQNLSIRSKNLWLQGLCRWVRYIGCSGTASVSFACGSWQVDTDSGYACSSFQTKQAASTITHHLVLQIGREGHRCVGHCLDRIWWRDRWAAQTRGRHKPKSTTVNKHE